MITVFNRKELIVTMEMNRQAEVRDDRDHGDEPSGRGQGYPLKKQY